MTNNMNSMEKVYTPKAGWPYLFLFGSLILVGVPLSIVFVAMLGGKGGGLLLAIPALIVGILGLCGLMAVQPNEARVLLLFGEYKGTCLLYTSPSPRD